MPILAANDPADPRQQDYEAHRRAYREAFDAWIKLPIRRRVTERQP